jgi:hypothetical protein
VSWKKPIAYTGAALDVDFTFAVDQSRALDSALRDAAARRSGSRDRRAALVDQLASWVAWYRVQEKDRLPRERDTQREPVPVAAAREAARRGESTTVAPAERADK